MFLIGDAFAGRTAKLHYFVCYFSSMAYRLLSKFRVYWEIVDVQVASYLVPRIRAVPGDKNKSSKYIRFLTGFKAYTQILAVSSVVWSCNAFSPEIDYLPTADNSLLEGLKSCSTLCALPPLYLGELWCRGWFSKRGKIGLFQKIDWEWWNRQIEDVRCLSAIMCCWNWISWDPSCSSILEVPVCSSILEVPVIIVHFGQVIHDVGLGSLLTHANC